MKTKLGLVVVILVTFGVFITQYVKKSETLEQKYLQVAMSPDGKWVAWVQQGQYPSHELTKKSVYLQNIGSPTPKLIATNGESMKGNNSISWSPDSKQFAFFSDASGTTQLYIAQAMDGTKGKITNLNGFLADPRWSPDGKSIALLYIEEPSRTPGAINAGHRQTGFIESKIDEQRVAIVDLASGKAQQISPPDMYVYEYDWSPDSQSIVLIAAHGAGDANWWFARLYTQNIETKTLTELYHPQYQISIPRWSPDGKSIAFISGIMSDQISLGGDIYTIPAQGGEATNVTPGIHSTPQNIYWKNPQTIIFVEVADGLVGISSLDIPSGKIDSLWKGSDPISSHDSMPGISLSVEDNNSAVIYESYAQPPEIWVGLMGRWKQLTRGNDAIKPNFGEMKSIHWMNGDQRLQGWLLYPTDYNPDKSYPMIVYPHGGPAAAATLNWGWYYFYELSSKGYFVFYPNIRGSFGHGDKFTKSNIKDFGYGDFTDLIAGVDEIVKTLPVNKKRIGIFGWSYGGYFAMWAVTQTDLFRAAVAGAGICNWQSYYGQNKINGWLIPYFEASIYDDPETYARSSPINFVKNVKTPTLILAAEFDQECPAAQSLEFYHALKTLGVKTQFFIFPDEGHGVSKPENIRDMKEQTIKWFDQHLK